MEVEGREVALKRASTWWTGHEPSWRKGWLASPTSAARFPCRSERSQRRRDRNQHRHISSPFGGSVSYACGRRLLRRFTKEGGRRRQKGKWSEEFVPGPRHRDCHIEWTRSSGRASLLLSPCYLDPAQTGARQYANTFSSATVPDHPFTQYRHCCHS